jgi:hypothetical protein
MHDLLMTSTPIPSDGVTKHRTVDQDEMKFRSVGEHKVGNFWALFDHDHGDRPV